MTRFGNAVPQAVQLPEAVPDTTAVKKITDIGSTIAGVAEAVANQIERSVEEAGVTTARERAKLDLKKSDQRLANAQAQVASDIAKQKLKDLSEKELVGLKAEVADMQERGIEPDAIFRSIAAMPIVDPANQSVMGRMLGRSLAQSHISVIETAALAEAAKVGRVDKGFLRRQMEELLIDMDLDSLHPDARFAYEGHITGTVDNIIRGINRQTVSREQARFRDLSMSQVGQAAKGYLLNNASMEDLAVTTNDMAKMHLMDDATTKRYAVDLVHSSAASLISNVAKMTVEQLKVVRDQLKKLEVADPVFASLRKNTTIFDDISHEIGVKFQKRRTDTMGVLTDQLKLAGSRSDVQVIRAHWDQALRSKDLGWDEKGRDRGVIETMNATINKAELDAIDSSNNVDTASSIFLSGQTPTFVPGTSMIARDDDGKPIMRNADTTTMIFSESDMEKSFIRWGGLQQAPTIFPAAMSRGLPVTSTVAKHLDTANANLNSRPLVMRTFASAIAYGVTEARQLSQTMKDPLAGAVIEAMISANNDPNSNAFVGSASYDTILDKYQNLTAGDVSDAVALQSKVFSVTKNDGTVGGGIFEVIKDFKRSNVTGIRGYVSAVRGAHLWALLDGATVAEAADAAKKAADKTIQFVEVDGDEVGVPADLYGIGHAGEGGVVGEGNSLRNFNAALLQAAADINRIEGGTAILTPQNGHNPTGTVAYIPVSKGNGEMMGYVQWEIQKQKWTFIKKIDRIGSEAESPFQKKYREIHNQGALRHSRAERILFSQYRRTTDMAQHGINSVQDYDEGMTAGTPTLGRFLGHRVATHWAKSFGIVPYPGHQMWDAYVADVNGLARSLNYTGLFNGSGREFKFAPRDEQFEAFGVVPQGDVDAAGINRAKQRAAARLTPPPRRVPSALEAANTQGAKR